MATLDDEGTGVHEKDPVISKHCQNMWNALFEDIFYEDIRWEGVQNGSARRSSMYILARGSEEPSVAQEKIQEDTRRF